MLVGRWEVGIGSFPSILYLLRRHSPCDLQLKKTRQKEEIGLAGNLINQNTPL